MNWDDLKVFLAVGRVGRLSKAAQSLDLDPTSIGRRIERLERDLNKSLFVRGPKGFVLTEDGSRLFERVRNMEAETVSPFEAESVGFAGRVRVGAPDGCSYFLMPQVIAGLQLKHPNLEIELISDSRNFDLMRKEVDIAISVRPHLSKSVDSFEIAPYRLVMACHKSLFELGRPPDISKNNYIGYLDDLMVDPSLKPNLEETPAGTLSSNSIMVQWAWICSGAGIGLVHDFALASALDVRAIYPFYNQARSYYSCRLRSRIEDKRLESIEMAIADQIRIEIRRLTRRI